MDRSYPAPRYPKLKRISSVEELMPRARALVKQPPGAAPWAMKPSYGIKEGHRILFVVLSEYDRMVVEAICRAIRELGARVDLMTIDSTPLSLDPEEVAAHEALAMGREKGETSYYYTMITDIISQATADALVELNNYDMVISGLAGPLPAVPYPWYRFCYISLEEFASDQIDFPFELQKLIDDKVFEQLRSCVRVRMTDPEGTDMTWSNYDDGRPYYVGHQYGRPVYIGYGFDGVDDCDGVVAGTLNHLGAFRHCKAVLKGGQVMKVEGGGKYGDAWREKLEQYRDVELPAMPKTTGQGYEDLAGVKEFFKLPGPGIFWFWENAIGTDPKVFRLPREGRFECYANFLHDRKRSGYIHNGFGPPFYGRQLLIERGLPWVHVHIHSVFPTWEGVTRDGVHIKVIDRGHLTALDDPDVRKFAARFGDPNKLLQEAWFPGMPGINMPGDYRRDYAVDPAAWIRSESSENSYWTG